MSILVNKDTKVVFQGITGEFGSLHARACIAYGTNWSPASRPAAVATLRRQGPDLRHRRGGGEARGRRHLLHLRAPAGAADAIRRAVDAGCKARHLHHRGHPVLDMVRVRKYIEATLPCVWSAQLPGE